MEKRASRIRDDSLIFPVNDLLASGGPFCKPFNLLEKPNRCSSRRREYSKIPCILPHE
jgi:hypothetical protein